MDRHAWEIYQIFNSKNIFLRGDIRYISYDTLMFANNYLLEATKYGCTKTLGNAIDALYRVGKDRWKIGYYKSTRTS